MNLLDFCNVYAGYNKHSPVLKDISFSLKEGDFVGLLGPNGSGKTTLLKTICRNINFSKGKILLNGQDIFSLRRREIASKVSFFNSDVSSYFPFTVEEIIFMGRYPYLNLLGRINATDKQIVYNAMKLTSTLGIKQRCFFEISSGEKIRVLLAQTLVQSTPLILLDEPDVHLDIKYRIEMFELLKRINEDDNITVLVALHNLQLAGRYCKKIIYLKNGRVFHSGATNELLKDNIIEEVYNIKYS